GRLGWARLRLPPWDFPDIPEPPSREEPPSYQEEECAMAASRTVDEIYKQQQIGEFMTTWEDFPRKGLAAWADRRKAGLMGTAKSTRYTPKFRPFDMLSEPNQSIVFLENDNHRIGAESVVGVQDAFHRYVDADIIYFQFCG